MSEGKPARSESQPRDRGKEAARREREAQALKRNLGRRKAQRRARAGDRNDRRS